MDERSKKNPLREALAFARSRPYATAGLKGLVLLTIVAALPVAPEGPFDARTYERPEGFRLAFPVAGALVEPLAAPAHAIAGAPDFRVAAVSTLVWIAVAAAAVVLVRESKRKPRRVWWGVALRTLGFGAAAGVVLLAYMAFAVAVRLPSWRLEREDPDFLIADFHSHTFASHDGLIGARANLEWHAARGFDVVAVTEHDDATGSFASEKLAAFFSGELPAVIPGLETRSHEGAYLLALGLDPGRGDDGGLAGLKGREDLFCDAVHTLHGGAVLALAWRLEADDVGRLVEAGVDGFEIANAGHPGVPDEVRRAVLDAASSGQRSRPDRAASKRLVLVADSDWHGWGGLWRTWTAVRVEGAASLPPAERAAAVLAALRERRAGDVVPVVAGYLGPPSIARAVLSPFAEALRYAAELSPARVVSWWVWAALVALAVTGLRRVGLRAGRMLLAAFLLVITVGLVWRGAELIWARAAGLTAFGKPTLAGGVAVGIGLAALAGALAIAVFEIRRVLPRADETVDGEDAGPEVGTRGRESES